MPLRVAAYTCLLWQELEKSGTIRKGDKLPPTLPMVIYNGDKPWKSARRLSDIVASIPPSLTKYQVNQEYFLLDEKRLSQLLLDNAKGEAGYIFRIERAKSLKEMWDLYREFKNRIAGAGFESLRKSINSG